MKVILNTNTVFEGAVLRAGDEIDVELKVAQRWINKGIAHPAFEIEAKSKTEIEVAEIKKPKTKTKKK